MSCAKLRKKIQSWIVSYYWYLNNTESIKDRLRSVSCVNANLKKQTFRFLLVKIVKIEIWNPDPLEESCSVLSH
jgi:hypothetical protein